jgi:hypothetical protein
LTLGEAEMAAWQTTDTSPILGGAERIRLHTHFMKTACAGLPTDLRKRSPRRP